MSMTTTMRAGVGVAGVAGVAALLLAVSPVAAAPPRCATTGLQVSQGLNQAAAGTASTVFALRNVSGRTCLLDGYPGMAFRTATGTLLRGTVRRGGSTVFRDPGAKVITLAPGGSASYSLAYTVPQTSTCRRTGQVQVTPPGATTSLTLRTPGQNDIWVCPGMPITVSALVAGRRGAPS